MTLERVSGQVTSVGGRRDEGPSKDALFNVNNFAAPESETRLARHRTEPTEHLALINLPFVAKAVG